MTERSGQTLVLGADHVADIVSRVGLDTLLDELIARLRNVAADLEPDVTITMERAGFQYEKPELGLVEWMPAMELGRLVSIKTVGYHPSNPAQRQTPSVLATTTLHDTTDGRILAITDATLLTALRTAAASAVATDVLAAPDAAVLGIIGCGAQAVTQIHAISRVRPISSVLAFDTNPAVAQSLASRTPVDAPITIVDSSDRIVEVADIICTATTVDIGAGPVMQDLPHKPHLHINAVGSDFPGKLELPLSMLERALVVPDNTNQCLLEGEAQQLRADQLGPDLAGLVKGTKGFRASQAALTVFDSTGWALEDMVAAELFIEHARALGIGLRLQLQADPDDPYNPYEGLGRQ